MFIFLMGMLGVINGANASTLAFERIMEGRYFPSKGSALFLFMLWLCIVLVTIFMAIP